MSVQLLGHLAGAAEQQPRRIGAVFLAFAPHFKAFSKFVTNYEGANAVLNRLRTQPKFVYFMEKQREQASIKQDFSSLLIAPVQRVPRYVLLIKELFKHTEPQHADYEDIAKALKELNRSARHINEEVRAFENRSKIVELETQFTTSPGFMAPGRILIKRGKIIKESSKDKNTEYDFFLFNDAIAYAKLLPLTGVLDAPKYQLHRLIKIDRHLGVSQRPLNEKSGTAYWPLQVSASQKNFVLLFKGEEERVEWKDAINQCIEDVTFRQRVDELVIPDGSSNKNNSANSKAAASPKSSSEDAAGKKREEIRRRNSAASAIDEN